jgi:hypothetical protein
MFAFKLCSLTAPKVDVDMDVRWEALNRRPRSGNLGRDELGHVAVGDPDPTSVPSTSNGYRNCRFEWTEKVSRTMTLLWSCTRELGHQGQHIAGTGEWVAAVHPQLSPTAPSPDPPASSSDQ